MFGKAAFQFIFIKDIVIHIEKFIVVFGDASYGLNFPGIGGINDFIMGNNPIYNELNTYVVDLFYIFDVIIGFIDGKIIHIFYGE